MSSPFRFAEAIVCRIPDALVKGEKERSGSHKENMDLIARTKNVDVQQCRAELEGLVTVLRDLGLDVVELPPDEACPLSPFVGDIAFVINGMGVVTRPKSSSRQGEVDTMRTVLKKELDIPVVEMEEEGAYLEGADILFTGRELFVGISNYTNEAGARFVANTFPEFPCSPIKVPEGDLHLTQYVNMASPDVICVGSGKDAQDVIKRMEREASFRYQKLTVPEDLAANVLYVNGTLVHLTAKEIPASNKTFADKLSMPRRSVQLTELSKLDASFHRLVLLLKKTKRRVKVMI